MYAGGTELIFACGGALEKSVIKAAEKEKGYVIGSDTDKRYDSSYVVTTAYKDLSQAVVRVLRSIYDTKDFESGFGGKTTMFGAAENCTGLPKSVFNDSNGDPFDRFMRFTKSAYDAEFSKVADGTVQIKRTVTVAEDNVYPTEQELTSGLGLFTVRVIGPLVPTIRICPFRSRRKSGFAVVESGRRADHNIESLAGERGVERLLVLIGGEVRKKVGDAELRVARLLADSDRDGRAVFFDDRAVKGERDRRPLVFPDTAVIMRLEISDAVLLEDGKRLEVKARAVDVSRADADTVFYYIA